MLFGLLCSVLVMYIEESLTESAKFEMGIPRFIKTACHTKEKQQTTIVGKGTDGYK